MNNFEMKYIAETDQYQINGELWCKAEPVAVAVDKKPYFPKPENGAVYSRIDNCGMIDSFCWRGDAFDRHQYHILNCWLDGSEAEAYVARYGRALPDRLTLAIRRWKIANGVKDSYQWHGENNYYITYGRGLREWLIDQGHSQYILNVEYFSKVKTAERCLEDLQEYFDDQLHEWNAESEGE